MKKARKTMVLAIALLAGVAPGLKAQQFKDVLKQILADASQHYQAESNYSDHTGYYPYTPPPSEADAAARNQHAYDVGYRVGQDDYHHHLSKHFTRHPDLFDSATHDAFANGYGAGYDAATEGASSRQAAYQPPVAIREPVKSDRYPSGYYPYAAPAQGQTPAERNRHAYEVGFRVGQDDFNHGHTKHFTHHQDLYDNESHDSFAHGYEDGYDRARSHQRSVQGASQPPAPAPALTARQVQGGVEVLVNGQVTTRIKSAMPNVEKTGLINGGSLMVVKSRGDHGPASVELFDTRTGVLRDKVLAFAIKDGRPSWANGYAD